MLDILSANIASLRKESGMTQSELAASVGVTFQAVSKWETGQTLPDTAILPKLAETFGVSMDKLFGYDVSAFDLSEIGIEKTKKLADSASVHVNVFRADFHDFRLDSEYDILYSSGVFGYMKPELRNEIIENTKNTLPPAGLTLFKHSLKSSLSNPCRKKTSQPKSVIISVPANFLHTITIDIFML
jgi:tellurite methyltransferase